MALEVDGGIRWFDGELLRKVANGMETYFWKEAWSANEPLCVLYPGLFSISCGQDFKVGEVWHTGSGRGTWRLPWRRELFAWENELLQSLFLRLEGVVLREGVDRWCWKPEEGGVFSIKSCFDILQDLWLVDGVLSGGEEVVFQNLWKSKATSKVLAFSWTLFFDRIPSKVNLAKRQLLAAEDSKRYVFFVIEMMNRRFICFYIVE